MNEMRALVDAFDDAVASEQKCALATLVSVGILLFTASGVFAECRGAGFVALITRPGGRMTLRGRRAPSLIGSSSGVVRHLKATCAAERPAAAAA